MSRRPSHEWWSSLTLVARLQWWSSSVWRMLCDQAGVIKLIGGTELAFAVSSDCKVLGSGCGLELGRLSWRLCWDGVVKRTGGIKRQLLWSVLARDMGSGRGLVVCSAQRL